MILEDLVENVPPYKRIELCVGDNIEIAGTAEVRAELYCNKCGKYQTFVCNDCDEVRHVDASREYRFSQLPTEKRKEHIQDKPCEDIYFNLFFYCAKCKNKYGFSFKTDRKEIMKVGQYPSFGDLQGNEINKYKNLIPKYFLEFKSSMNCFSQGKGIAAFVYLRRILEDIVSKQYEKIDKENINVRFIDKMKKVQEVEEIIPHEFDDVREALYSTLSKGVHEYTEEECKELYPYVKFVITEILDRQLLEIERAKKIEEVKKKLKKTS